MPINADIRNKLVPGARVKVIQQIAARNYTWTTDLTGTVVEFAQKETGTWFAHSRDDKLWLDRLLLRNDDGELTTLNLDDYSVVEVLETPDHGTSETKKNESDLPV